MWNYLLFLPSILLGTCKTIYSKKVKNKTDNFFTLSLNNVWMFLVAFIVAFIFNISKYGFTLNVPFWICLGYAVATLLSQVFLMLAVDKGPVSLTSLFYFCSFIIPTISGSVIYNEPLQVNDYCGIAMILVAFALANKYEKGKKFNILWLIYTILAAGCSGVVGLLQKIFTNTYKEYPLYSFLSGSFLLIIAMSALCVGIYAMIKKFKHESVLPVKEETVEDINGINEQDKLSQKTLLLKKWMPVINVVILGICLAGVNILNTYISGIFPSAITFPFINGGCILSTVIFSSIIFKEKLTIVQIIGILLGISGIIVIAVI